jgi:hypothetical protein
MPASIGLAELKDLLDGRRVPSWEWSGLSAATAAHCPQQSMPTPRDVARRSFRRHLSLAKYEDVRARLSNEPLLRTAGDRAGLIANPSAGMGHAAGAGTRKPTSRL